MQQSRALPCEAAERQHNCHARGILLEPLLDIAVRKNWESHIDASHSRQPLVKGERLVRYEVNAVIQTFAFLQCVYRDQTSLSAQLRAVRVGSTCAAYDPHSTRRISAGHLSARPLSDCAPADDSMPYESHLAH